MQSYDVYDGKLPALLSDHIILSDLQLLDPRQRECNASIAHG